MGLDNFSSMFEVGATLNLAFVAVEYANSYTNVLAKYVYKLHDKIKAKFDVSTEMVDKSSIDTLQGNNLDGQNTIIQVEQLKRDYENLCNRTERIHQDILDNINEKCHFRCFAFISLYLSLYSLTALFVAGMKCSDWTYLFWSFFSVISVIGVLFYSIFVWQMWCKEKITSLIVCIVSYVFILVVSLCCTYYVLIDIEILKGLYSWISPLTSLIPYMNFIAFAFIMKRRSQYLYQEAEGKINTIKEEWESLKRKLNDLSAVNRIASDMRNQEPIQS